MDDSINFVRNRRQKLTKQQQLDLRIFRIVAGLFGVIIGVYVVCLAAVFYLQFRLSQIQDEQNRLESQISDQESVEQSVVVTIEKLKVLASLFELRYDKQAAIEFFSNLFGPEVLIKDINYQSDDRILSLRLQSNSVFALENVFSKLTDPQIAERFGQVNKSGLTRDSTGSYNLVITLSLAEEEKPARPTRSPAANPQP